MGVDYVKEVTHKKAFRWDEADEQSAAFDLIRGTRVADARNVCLMVDRRHRELDENDVAKISNTYHVWRGEEGNYEDIPGFCKSVKLEEVKKHDYILTSGRYVGLADENEDLEEFEKKMQKMTSQLAEQFKKSDFLEKEIQNNLKDLGYEI